MRATRAAVVAAVTLAGAACTTVRGGGASPGPVDRATLARCRFVAGQTDAGRVLELAGSYELVLFDDADPPRWTAGTLRLEAPEVPPREPTASEPAAPLLVGAAELDASLVGAAVPGPAGSRDPAAPGVGMYVFPTPGSATLAIVLRLGAEANRRDRQRFDGAHTTLRVTAVGEDRLGGEWSSDEGGRHAEGGFCAIRR